MTRRLPRITGTEPTNPKRASSVGSFWWLVLVPVSTWLTLVTTQPWIRRSAPLPQRLLKNLALPSHSWGKVGWASTTVLSFKTNNKTTSVLTKIKSLVWRGKKKNKNQAILSRYRTEFFNYCRRMGMIYACYSDCSVCRCCPRTTLLLLCAPTSHRGQARASDSLETSTIRQPHK